jgi:hypothetical protein
MSSTPPTTLSPTDQSLINSLKQQEQEMFAMQLAVTTAEEQYQAESSVPMTAKADARNLTQ